MATFLSPRRLILDMNACSPLFYEQFREFHDGCKTAVACVSVGNYRSKEIGTGHIPATGLWDG